MQEGYGPGTALVVVDVQNDFADPAGGLAAGVVGFVGLDGEGLGGMELGLQRELAGRDGSLTYESGPGGRQISTAASAELDPVHGVDVRLTIDRDIQWQAQQLIAQRVKDANADSGSVVVLDPRTGAVLALATAPTFDPADPGASPVADRGNRALSDIYEPGSTSKIMTAAAVLEEGALRPDSPVTVPPTLRFGDKVFHDHNEHPTLHLTFTGVLAKRGVTISMDGRGRCMDNIFIERLWRSLKYEEVYLHDYRGVPDARTGIGNWLRFYNHQRFHQSLEYRTPAAVFRAGQA